MLACDLCNMSLSKHRLIRTFFVQLSVNVVLNLKERDNIVSLAIMDISWYSIKMKVGKKYPGY